MCKNILIRHFFSGVGKTDFRKRTSFSISNSNLISTTNSFSLMPVKCYCFCAEVEFFEFIQGSVYPDGAVHSCPSERKLFAHRIELYADLR